MSEKRAKENRKRVQSDVLYQIVATVKKNGEVSVQGFPANVQQANHLVSQINLAMWGYFIDAAKNGLVDEKGFARKRSIVEPTQKDIEAINGK